MKKLILHIPHASTNIPFFDGYISDFKKINAEIVKITDWYTDDLFSTQNDDKLITPFSRVFCDVERFADDNLEKMSKFGMGVLYDKFDDGAIMREVSAKLRKTILKEYYWNHHNKLTNLVEKHLKTNESCLIVDCHSFPAKTLNRALNKSAYRPDFNIGTDSFHTPKKLIELSVNFFESRGYSLGIDSPYSGTMVPITHYKKEAQVHSIMLEVNRKLYLNGETNIKSKHFKSTQQVVQSFLNTIRNYEI